MNDKHLALTDGGIMAKPVTSTEKLLFLPAYKPSKTEIHAEKVMEDMQEISAACKAAGHRWALWALFSDLMALASDIARETEGAYKP